ncbi:Heme O synthase, protoheme IX farnesyltransferase COX10-CtaB [invertebrate metagenome]|uniref:Heme O synthase, protoheme IX farnesyltransferase COX10-CtaB n=1 Tax=invertebrate metagenome TaxID=1711999 RepID=A0A484H6F9_9ZZZZ
MTVRSLLQLLKLRIGVTIALTSVIGYLAVANQVNGPHLAMLALAMLLGSASSSIFNHFYDRDIDRLMSRTAHRPLAAGVVERPRLVLWLAAALLLAGLSLAVTTFNWVVAMHLLLGVFFYGIVYTVWLKRRTWLNIVIGGAAGSFAVLAGAAAVDPTIWLLPWLLALTLFLWTPSHFWALAILLKEDYQRANVPMLPCLIGEKRTVSYIFVNSLLLVSSSLLPWLVGELGHWYGVSVLFLGVWFMWINFRLLLAQNQAMARMTFLGSMQYLLGVFLSVLADKHLLLP